MIAIWLVLALFAAGDAAVEATQPAASPNAQATAEVAP